MKLNKFFLFAVATLTAMFSSCSSSDDITVGEQDSDKPFVYLSESNKLNISMEPTEPTELTFKVCRRDSVAAAEIPLTVSDNTDNVFNVPEKAVFAAGSKETTVKVTFPNAPIGKPCSFRVGFGPEYAGIYKEGTREQVFTVNRVKWNSLGEGQMYEGFILEEEVPVEILQRDDKPTVFRVVKPFHKYSNLREAASEYIEVTVLQPKDQVNGVAISQKDLVYFTPTNSGYFHSTYSAYIMMYHPAQFPSLQDEANFGHSVVLSYQEDGKTPGQIQLAPYYYMDGVGGWNQTQEDGMVVITFPGFVPQYEADIESDFEYDEVFEGEFKSELLGKSSTSALYKGTCVETKDDCDKRFAEQYGTLYKVASPYAEDYHLTFLVKKGSIVLPAGPEYDLQATGLTALGKDVYAHINGDKSVFENEKIVLNITFTDADGDIVYGTANETLENVKWNNIGKGLYTDGMIAPLFGEAAPTYAVEILECENKPGLYRVMNPYSNSVYPYADDDCAAEGTYVEIDATDPNGVLLNEQSLGFDWGYGEFSIISIGSYYIQYGGYDKATMKKAGYLGTLKNGVINFPVPADEGVGGLVLMGGKAYNADTDGSFKVVLPSAAAAKSAPKKVAPAKVAKKSLKKSVKTRTIKKKVQFSVRKSGKVTVKKSYNKKNPTKMESPMY